MSTPSLYNYYTNRDELVTDLLVESYTHQAEVLEQASASCQAQEPVTRLLTSVLAYQQWVVGHPHEFALISGSPIPGYLAPVEQTLPLGRRCVKVLLDILQRAWEERLLGPQASPPDIFADALQEEFLAWCREQGYTLPVIALFLELYAFLQGMMALEVFGHLPFFLTDPLAFYRSAILTRFSPFTA